MSGMVLTELACAVNKNRSCKNREQRVLGPRLHPMFPAFSDAGRCSTLSPVGEILSRDESTSSEASWDRWVIWVSLSTGAVASRLASNDDVRP
jgi:hypothetical protein